jgi:hypothetical protein
MIAIEIDTSQPVQALNVMVQNTGDFSEPIAEVLTSALSDARLEVEASKGGLFGAAWRPMSPFTADPPAFLQRLGVMHSREPSALLEDTGGLAASLERGGPNNIFDVSPTEGQTGTSDPAAVLQQEGTSRVFDVLHFFASRGQRREFITPGIPARPFLSWHEERLEDYDRIFSSHVFNGVAGA